MVKSTRGGGGRGPPPPLLRWRCTVTACLQSPGQVSSTVPGLVRIPLSVGLKLARSKRVMSVAGRRQRGLVCSNLDKLVGTEWGG